MSVETAQQIFEEYEPSPEDVCEDCQGNRYRMATRSDGQRAIERCDTCSQDITDDEAVALFLCKTLVDLDEWFESDEKERTPRQMLDHLRSMLSWVAQPADLEEDRCEHGMFFSGAGACPKCGRGAE